MSRLIVALVLALTAARAEAAIPEVDAPVQAAVAADHTAAWEAHLRGQRALGLQRLRAYADAGVFPQVPAGITGFHHQFLDANGTPCAVAHLMWTSGNADLVRQTAATDNGVVLSDVRDGPLVAWMLGSGFTREEIAVIQEPGWHGGLDLDLAPEPVDPEQERIRGHLYAVLGLLEVDGEKSIAKALRRVDVQSPPPTS